MKGRGTFVRDCSLESNNLITIVVDSKIHGGHLELGSAACLAVWWGYEGRKRGSSSGKYGGGLQKQVEPSLSRGHVIALDSSLFPRLES